MARVSTYLNFQGRAEEAFAFYAKTFGTEITMLSRYSDMPAAGPGELPAEEQREVVRAIVRRELGVMTLAALIIVVLLARAASTAG